VKNTVVLLLLFCSAGVFAQEGESDDGRGQLIYRLGEKYEIYAYEKKSASSTMRKYTYVIEGSEAGSDEVYLCNGSAAAVNQFAVFLKELAQTGAIEERVFNVMDMRLCMAENEAYTGAALFLRYNGKWRVSLSSTARAYKKEVDTFRRQYEYF
jgi:hypothetical protein